MLMCGGLAGIITWASIFPLDVIKTRVQTQLLRSEVARRGEQQTLLHAEGQRSQFGAIQIARHAYQTEGGIRMDDAYFATTIKQTIRGHIVTGEIVS